MWNFSYQILQDMSATHILMIVLFTCWYYSWVWRMTRSNDEQALGHLMRFTLLLFSPFVIGIIVAFQLLADMTWVTIWDRSTPLLLLPTGTHVILIVFLTEHSYSAFWSRWKAGVIVRVVSRVVFTISYSCLLLLLDYGYLQMGRS